MNKSVKTASLFCFLIVATALSGSFNSGWPHGAKSGSVGPEELNKLIGKTKILDVRSFKAYEIGHIETALCIPLQDLSQSRLHLLGFEKSDEIVIYADSDRPAKQAKLFLEAMEFIRVTILAGGLTHWKEDGMQTVTGKVNTSFTIEEQLRFSALQIEPEEHDFGIVRKDDGIVKTVFDLINQGSNELSIKEIS